MKRTKRRQFSHRDAGSSSSGGDLDVAIIGVSVRFPGAANLEELWENLQGGKSAIAAMPAHRCTPSARRRAPDDLCQLGEFWGGFIEDADCFDAAFFGISPREAAAMDPQQRMALELAWGAIEDGGYSAAQLAGSDTAVFMGVCHSDYLEIIEQQATRIDSYYSTGIAYSIIANRISHALDLQGASVTNDTACASSLVAVQQAVEALQQGSCALALAGGVNVCWSVNHYIAFTRNGMLSRDGRCKTFDAAANGYVRGEGGAILLLKPLTQARADGDHVYGLIKGIGSNHGGRTSSLTATNPSAQADLIGRVVARAGVPAGTISYIETHGTGTPLGDPIEIHGLQMAFQRLEEGSESPRRVRCGLGSIKTNIGHLEGAAGVAGMVKVLLCMREKALPATLNFSSLNPLIELNDTSFYVVASCEPWNPSVDGVRVPRRAGVSSFGFGGVNAHVVLEELEEEQTARAATRTAHCIVLSAKTRTALLARAEQLRSHLLAKQYADTELGDIAYTLQVGRDGMSYRFGVMAHSVGQLAADLQSFISGVPGDTPYYECAPLDTRKKPAAAVDADLSALLEACVQSGQHEALLSPWVQGREVEWSRLYAGTQHRRFSLPTYPFERKRFWAEGSVTPNQDSSARLHPLLHANSSSLKGLAFDTLLDGAEFFLADHVVKGHKVLPGVAHLEMAHAAVRRVIDPSTQALWISDVAWIRPLVVAAPTFASIRLLPIEGGEIQYEIHAGEEAQPPQLHSQGRVRIANEQPPARLDLDELAARCAREFATTARAYDLFEAMGIAYGKGHRALSSIKVGRGDRNLPEVLAQIELPDAVQRGSEEFHLHPSILDAAFQVTMLFPALDPPASTPPLTIPFALRAAHILRPCPHNAWAWVRFAPGSRPGDANQKLDISVCDGTGEVCVEIAGFTSRVVSALDGERQDSPELLLSSVEWRAAPPVAVHGQAHATGRQVLLAGAFSDAEVRELHASLADEAACERLLTASGARIAAAFTDHAGALLEKLQLIVGSKPSAQLLLQLVVRAEELDVSACLVGLSGMLKTAALESSRLRAQSIVVPSALTMPEIVEILRTEAQSTDAVIRYQQGKREVIRLRELTAGPAARAAAGAWRCGGVYLITGGLGELGLLVAEDIAARTGDATLVLIGRSVPTSQQQARLQAVMASGARVDTASVDVADADAVRSLVERCTTRYGALHGVIHCAGVIRDAFLAKKTATELREVLAPKIIGTINLDEATQRLELDQFVLFSSVAGAFGNLGQADYAAANAFMDAYAGYRNELVLQGRRRGRSLSIGWPLWQDGGMQVDQAVLARMRRSGLAPLRSGAGLEALSRCVSQDEPAPHIVVLSGARAVIEQNYIDVIERSPIDLDVDVDVEVESECATAAAQEDSGANAQLLEKTLAVLKSKVAELLRVPLLEIGVEDELAGFGFDSISFTELANQLNDFYRLRLTPTLFFEQPTLQALADHLLQAHRSELVAIHDSVSRREAAKVQVHARGAVEAPGLADEGPRPATQTQWQPEQSDAAMHREPVSRALEPMAIVGMSCCMPQAQDAQQFWGNLLAGRDCISEVPADRWDWQALYGDPAREHNRTNVKCAGFIDRIDAFDPLFFGISPKEAELMDPQQRLLLMHAWLAIEDAGYAPESLAGSNTGVFIGLQANDYIPTADLSCSIIESYSATGRIPCIGPNRVSYFFDLHGPSEPIDTACSSALVAIHRAVRAIQSGDCEMALSGGVNSLVRPDYQISFSKAGMLAPDGRCKTFSAHADGYGRGEGIGVLLIKKLSDAQRADDRIHALIIGSAENHGGNANSLTAPNPKAQANLIRAALREARIDPGTVTYVETHGTGTPLGDPIEVNGLKLAFQPHRSEQAYCGLGSVKTNIGHLEIAAGAAGLIKVLLQMQHGTLVKSLHCEAINPYLELAGSPFYIVREARPWARLTDAAGQTLPRRAGVSSFGFGGANAHVIVEEYRQAPRAAVTLAPGQSWLVVLSAKHEQRLQAQAQRLLDHLSAPLPDDVGVGEIAYTLQVGREAMEHRLGFTAHSVEELRAKLRGYLHGQPELAQCYSGQVKKNKEVMSLLNSRGVMQDALLQWLRRAEYGRVLELWVKGLGVQWSELYGAGRVYEEQPRRASLPGYAFAQERYWLQVGSAERASAQPRQAQLHALLHRNTSSLKAQRYSTRLSGAEFYLQDHRVQGEKVLAGVCSLEMARAAVQSALETGECVELRNVVWLRPVQVRQDALELHIELQAVSAEQLQFEIYSQPVAERCVHVQGTAVLRAEQWQGESLDLQGLQAGCQRELEVEQCYARYERMGLKYGPGHRGLSRVQVGQDAAGRYVLAEVKIPSGVSGEYVLHPSVLDGALQASVGLWEGEESSPRLPFAVASLQFSAQGSPRHAWVVIRGGSRGAVEKLEVAICDEHGQVRVHFHGFSSRVLAAEAPQRGERALYERVWEAQAAPSATVQWAQRPIYVEEEYAAALQSSAWRVDVLDLSGQASGLLSAAGQLYGRLREVLQGKPTGPVLLQVVVSEAQYERGLCALGGLLKSAQQEHGKLVCQLIVLGAGASITQVLAQESTGGASEVRYAGTRREVLSYRELDSAPRLSPWVSGGVYWISGGAGGLGRIVAQEIARSVRGARLILSGRSASSAALQEQLDVLERAGAQAQYWAVDVTDAPQVSACLARIVSEHGRVDGIVHSAGVIADGFMVNKPWESSAAVLGAKVQGTLNVLSGARSCGAKFVVLFGSVSGVLGNAGQSDYALGNAFVDGCARSAPRGEGRARVLSIDWPLWAEGGMQMEPASRSALLHRGLQPLPTASGIEALYEAWGSERSQVVVLYGERAKLQPMLVPATREVRSGAEPREQVSAGTARGVAGALLEAVEGALIEMISQQLKVRAAEIDVEVELGEFGFDSISLTKFSNSLNEAYGLELSPTIFFEYPTVRTLAGHLSEQHPAMLTERLAVRSEGLPQESSAPQAPSFITALPRSARFIEHAVQAQPASRGAAAQTAVAIIGMSARFPGAADVASFWENLSAAEESIHEIPASRWDWQSIYGDPQQEVNKTNVKWGGFIEGVAEFDPLFFNISPREAESMDPQQRLLLMYTWQAIEDAGYGAQSLWGTRTGVFVGITGNGYGDLLSQCQQAIEAHSSTGLNPSIAPNRISYFLNLHGPSEPIDTACSSSLVAVHRAVRALRSEECDLALVGGINTIITPWAHISFSKAGMLSEDGRCKTFSSAANGYVRGEGVGMLFLKPLAAAQADGDHIYGLIRGSAENHGGRANSLTAPNPKAQAELIKAAYREAQIDPRTVSYIEAHGTGTALGDPIEINGLKSAFAELYAHSGAAQVERAHCGLGSVKTNIGHLEVAAGVAGVIKVLLQLQHRTLVKSLHCEQINPYIQLQDSPFYIVRERQPWMALRDESGVELPRRAGVSSFGFGGVNAHVVLEEYCAPVESGGALPTADHPAMIVLSAKSEVQLQEQVQRLLSHLGSQAYTDADLLNLAFTLQVGRDAMEHRLALTALTIDELKEKLAACASSMPEDAGVRAGMRVYRGDTRQSKDVLGVLNSEDMTQRLVRAWLDEGRAEKFLELWVQGLRFDWQSIHAQRVPAPRRLSLPTYPFAREKYWPAALPSGAPQPHAMRVAVPAERVLQPQQAPSAESANCTSFVEEWQEAALVSGDSSEPLPATLVVVLADRSTQAAMLAEMAQLWPATRVVFLEPGMAMLAVDRSTTSDLVRYPISGDSAEAHADTLRAVADRHGPISALWYFWSHDAADDLEDPGRILRLLQGLTRTASQARVLLAASWRTSRERCHVESFIACATSISRAAPAIQLAVIQEDRSAAGSTRWPLASDARRWVRRLFDATRAAPAQNVLYRAGRRYLLQIKESMLPPNAAASALRRHGAYLITGGLGGLGYLFAKHLARSHAAKLILIGRSPLDARKARQLDALALLGGQAIYVAADVGNIHEMHAALQQGKQMYGELHGVIHAAGVECSDSIVGRAWTSIESVLRPKVQGTEVLAELLQDTPLDFCCYFSSLAALLGDFGSCDYAMANRFQLAHAIYASRNAFAICWPLWADGGMKLEDGEATALYLRSSGQQALREQQGLQLFERMLAARQQRGFSHAAIVLGERGNARRVMGLQPVEALAAPGGEVNGAALRPLEPNQLRGHLVADLENLASEVLKLPREQVAVDENLADFGFDSLLLAAFANHLARRFHIDLQPSVFFSYPTLLRLAAHLAAEHPEKLQQHYAPTSAETSRASMHAAARPAAMVQVAPARVSEADPVETRIAIVGMSGRFPGARSVAEFWELLRDGAEAITEIPAERFEWRDHYQAPCDGRPGAAGKMSSRWLGALGGVDEFDPTFFEITPQEAEAMDPRQRLLLQESFHALEDAGYGSAQLSAEKIGMFVGAEQGDYQELLKDLHTGSRMTGNHDAVLASRLSYFLDLRGPVMLINTACSSGLVALHQACQSLRAGECDSAVVASANLILAPTNYILMSDAGMLSPRGRCFTFDARADGMVPGEAVVALVLKSVARARACGDRIHAMVRGSGINCDGKTNGLTAPNGAAQAELISGIYARAKVPPADIEYIVAHGTGTWLGDPVEVNALVDVFKRSVPPGERCALTSTKTNVGHTFAASGLVSLIGLVQALRHEMIPASLNCEQPSDYIDWQGSAFYVNTRTRAWPRSKGKNRLGAVSAFGMSGTNAHVVVEGADQEVEADAPPIGAPGYLLALSAKTEAALRERASALASWLRGNCPSVVAPSVAALTHTLLVRRQHFAHRRAVVIEDSYQALEVLERIGRGETWPALLRGVATPDEDESVNAVALVERAVSHREDAARYRDSLAALGELHCRGREIPWAALYGNAHLAPLALPAYPFARERYWIRPGGLTPPVVPSGPVQVAARPMLEPNRLPDQIAADLANLARELLSLPPDPVAADENLAELGFDSLLLTRFANRIARHFDIELSPSVFFRHPTLVRLAAHLAAKHPEKMQRHYAPATAKAGPAVNEAPVAPAQFAPQPVTAADSAGIAIVGMSGRFPGARSVAEFWELLRDGADAVTEIPAERFEWRDHYQAPSESGPGAAGKMSSRWLGALAGVEEFDPAFFEISPREAEAMDPRQRLLLQESFHALEDAGYGSAQLSAEKIGMFVGAEQGDYQELLGGSHTGNKLTGNHDAILAARLSYFLDLRGPVLSINTACSSGLVALHQACQSLRDGECDSAIAASANLILTSNGYIVMSEAGMLSPRGRCFTFDARADGIVPGEAVVALVLKSVARARACGDRIHAIVRGSGINYDGKTNGLTAPNGEAQTELISGIYARAKVRPADVDYIVTHGTGTRLGDPVEIDALLEAFKDVMPPGKRCALTSTKTNVGHTFAASGLVSLIGLVQALRHEMIPASLNCEQPSDYIDWQGSAFYVNTRTRAWPRSKGKNRLGAVSAFGMSGTNAHVVVEGADQQVEADAPPIGAPGYLLALSAKTEAALRERASALARWLRDARARGNCPSAAALTHTLLVRRQQFAHRRAVLIEDCYQAIELLERIGRGETWPALLRSAAAREGSDAVHAAALVERAMSQHHDAERYRDSLAVLGELYCRGQEIPWAVLYAEARLEPLSLPPYPFKRERYWIKPASTAAHAPVAVSLAVNHHVELRPEESAEAPRASSQPDKPSRITLRSLVEPSVVPQEVLRPQLTLEAVVAGDIDGPSDMRPPGAPPSASATAPASSAVSGEARLSLEQLEIELTASLAQALYMESSDVDPQRAFIELGLDSIIGVEWMRSINRRYGSSLSATKIYDYPTVRGFAAWLHTKLPELAPAATAPSEIEPLVGRVEARAELTAPQTSGRVETAASIQTPVDVRPPSQLERAAESRADCHIAIVGMSGRYPGSANLSSYWENLAAGRDLVQEIPSSRWELADYYDPQPGARGRMYCKWLGWLEDVEYFDPLFFNISPSEAQAMDPQARLFLEEGYRAFQDAGYATQALSNAKCGVYLGIVGGEYAALLQRQAAHLQDITGNSTAIAAARIAYCLNLKGPAMPIDTACSSSLVATHLACQGLRNREIDLALAGGVSVYLNPQSYVGMCAAGMLSADGRCKTFDNGANGFVPGEGVGVLVLKRLPDAEAAGDRIHGIIIASGINQDGKTNGIMAPSVTSQVELMRSLYARYGIRPQSISYVEAHGTGTNLGDPIELEALATVFQEHTDRRRYCAIGSVKSNIGHASAAAGIAGVHKVLLALRHRELVPSLHFTTPNQHFDFDSSPFFVNTERRAWATEGSPRRAAVSSFGYSGTNAHVVIEEYQGASQGTAAQPALAPQPELLVLSARSEEQLEEQVRQLQVYLESAAGAEVDLADIAYTLQRGRDPMEWRLAVIGSSKAQAASELARFIARERRSGVLWGTVRKHRDAHSEVAGEDLNALLGSWVRSRALPKLADAWMRGSSIDWEALYHAAAGRSQLHPRRVSLPTYPFAKQRCWIESAPAGMAESALVDAATEQAETGLVAEPSALAAKLQGVLVQVISQQQAIEAQDIGVDTELTDFGFDSIRLTELGAQLNRALGLQITPAIFFEHRTVQTLVSHLLKQHLAELSQHFGIAAAPTRARPKAVSRASAPRRVSAVADQRGQRHEPIAVIGMSGRFPMAQDITQFWDNLRAGRDCISEIPSSRWDWRAVYGDPTREVNKTHIKWGGFIEGVDEFDSLFFGISPHEAELMDPQQRLLMTYTWKCIEDAGYSPASLSGTRTGIFAGTIISAYGELILRANVPIEGYSSTGTVSSVGPNRMSFMLNLRGPSEPIETACSSSLVAIHRAVRAIQSDDCEMALVGGVNTIITAGTHIAFSKAGMLAEDGRCKTFSKSANGYVRSEGVGMLFLKKLSQAEHDGDHIYGLIRGSSENHGGRASSLTAPNPQAQAELIKTAWRESGVDPRTVSYIEAHGTGTPLGDPIEINGLKNAFADLHAQSTGPAPQRVRCGIGSVKTNIGHLELAAGVAGVIKVLLQLQHRTLVKSLHSEDINPYIQLQDSPFYIVRELQPWEALQDAQGNELPRRAGVSSFGFGGVNAHVVIEEHRAAVRMLPVAATAEHPALVVLSARNEERLKEQVQQLLAQVRQHTAESLCLLDLAYTLQVGREAMEHRIAWTAHSLEELGRQLAAHVDDPADRAGAQTCLRGEVRKNKDAFALLNADESATQLLESWFKKGKYAELLSLWVKGLQINWANLYESGSVYGAQPVRISLPTYPFARERRWVEPEPVEQPPPAHPSRAAPLDNSALSRILDELATQRLSVDAALAQAGR
jgi:acyl transferase domain-containing protein